MTKPPSDNITEEEQRRAIGDMRARAKLLDGLLARVVNSEDMRTLCTEYLRAQRSDHPMVRMNRSVSLHVSIVLAVTKYIENEHAPLDGLDMDVVSTHDFAVIHQFGIMYIARRLMAMNASADPSAVMARAVTLHGLYSSMFHESVGEHDTPAHRLVMQCAHYIKQDMDNMPAPQNAPSSTEVM